METCLGDLDWPLNASRRLSAIAEFLVICLLTQNNANTAACRSATKPQCECDEGGNDAKHCNVSWSRISLNQSWQCVSGSWVRDQMGQQIWVGHVGHMTRWPILYCTHPISHVIFWFTNNGNGTCYFDSLLVHFHNRCNNMARAESFWNAQISLGRSKFCWNLREERLTDVN